MKFFILSKCGEGAGLGFRLITEGNDVCIKIHEKDYANVYDGIIERADEPEKDALVIVDSSGLGKEADELKSRGFLVFGGSQFADKLENDREFGFNFMKKHGINTPRTENFKSFSGGIKYVKERDTKLVFKPSGKTIPCKLTYCAEDSNELTEYMKFVEKYYSKDIDDFIIQDFIEGEVISTEFWVGKNGLITPANHTIEVKKFLNDNLGPSTGCQGNLVWFAEDDFIVDTLLKIEDSLKSENFIGCIDLNCIINDKGLYGLEWTPRFGLDAMPTFLKLTEYVDIGKLIYDVTTGTVHEMNGLDEDLFAAGIRLSIPPYPAEPYDANKLEKEVPSAGIPLDCLTEVSDLLYAYEVRCEDGKIVHSNGTGVIAVLSDVAESPEDCFQRPYDALDHLQIPDKQYRTDLDSVLPEMYRKVMEIL